MHVNVAAKCLLLCIIYDVCAYIYVVYILYLWSVPFEMIECFYSAIARATEIGATISIRVLGSAISSRSHQVHSYTRESREWETFITRALLFEQVRRWWRVYFGISNYLIDRLVGNYGSKEGKKSTHNNRSVD